MLTRRRGLLWIAGFKLFKCALLVGVGLGALSLLHRDVAEVFDRLVDALHVDPDNRLVHWLLAKLLALDERKLRALGAGTFFYAGLLAAEGTGLLFEKRWAEYLTTIGTASLIPLEVYEMARKPGWGKAAAIAINVAVVWYLIRRLREERAAKARK